jgi:hypothetical protein
MRVEGRLLTTLSNKGTSTLSQAKSKLYVTICAIVHWVGMEKGFEFRVTLVAKSHSIYNSSLL